MNTQISNENTKSKTKDFKEEVLGLSLSNKIKFLNDLKVAYPKMRSILDTVEECQDSTKLSTKPKCLSIIGPSGSGKTTLMEIHKKNYPDIDTFEGVTKNILYSRIPCPARIGSLPTKLLYDLGDPFYSKKSSIAIQTQRLYNLLASCNVKLIILDEVQHLVDRNSEKLIRDSSDWFKELIDNCRIPVIFLGMPESKRIFVENQQLANRVSYYEELEPFKYDNTFRVLLNYFDESLPFPYVSGLAQQDISIRIHIATKGLMKHIRDLIVESSILALKHEHDRITMPILAKTFDKILSNVNEKNPFLPGFEL